MKKNINKNKINLRTFIGDISFIIATLFLIFAVFECVYSIGIINSYLLLLIAVILGIIGSVCLLYKKNWKIK